MPDSSPPAVQPGTARATAGSTRRQFIQSASALAGLGMLGLGFGCTKNAPAGSATGATGSTTPVHAAASRNRVLRVAHITDMHIQPELSANLGVSSCLAHIMAQDDRPGLLVTGGDLVFDSFAQPEPRTRELWNLWGKTLRDGTNLPVLHTLGNHDVWGWNKSKSKTTGQEALWGKAWACQALGLARPYHASVQAGGAWKVICLDSVFPDGESYIGRLDEAQLHWLQGELDATPAGQHIMVVSHIPILSVCSLFDKKAEDPVRVNPSTMHADANLLHPMFVKSGKVRLVLSGHIHQNDRLDYQGISYICDGAVCGAWWKGPGDRCTEGYGTIDLFADGTFDHHYQTYGWQAVKA